MIPNLDAFWEMFAREHWEQRPGVFRNLLGDDPLIRPAEAFTGVMKAATLTRNGQPAFIRFFLENALVQSRLDKYLPIDADKTFATYAERIRPVLRGQNFGLTVNGFAHHDFELFMRVRRFLHGLYERVGMPGSHADVDVFIGNYLQTPFGIHLDKASNFSVVYEGTKRFLLWPGPALADRRDLHHSLDFDDVRSEAVVLEGGPGDVIYWPSSYWHIAESSGELSAVMNIALYLADPPSRTVPWATDPPAEDLHAWLTRTTAYHLDRSRPHALPLPESLDPETQLTIEPGFPIRTVERAGTLFCAAHGHVVEFPAVPKVIHMIEDVNRGAPRRTRDLIAAASGPGTVHGTTFHLTPADVESVLTNLVAMRALREVVTP